MGSFALWTLVRTSGRTIEIDLTLANAPGIEKGSKDLVQSCLAKIGITWGATSWQVRPFRSVFFTDYPDNQNWKNRWRLGWSILLQVPNSIQQPADQVFIPYEWVDEHDETCSGLKDEDGQRCRAIVMFARPMAGAIDRQEILEPFEIAGFSIDHLAISEGTNLSNDSFQFVRLVIEDRDIDVEAEQLEQCTTVVANKSWITNWQML